MENTKQSANSLIPGPLGARAGETRAIEEFTRKTLNALRARDGGAPLVEPVGAQQDRVIEWRHFINHFFFIERGFMQSGEASSPAETLENSRYMRLVRRQNGADTELVAANINFSDSWRLTSVDTGTAGANLCVDVECTEEAVVGRMIQFLFDQGYMVADLGEENVDEHVEI